MSKNKRKHKGGYKPPPPPSAADIVKEIVRLATEITNSEDPGPLWGQLHKVLLRSAVDHSVAAAIIMHRDETELASVIEQLSAGEAISIGDRQEDIELPEIPFKTKKDAMRVFRNRAKFIKLDRESKLGSGPLTYGKEASFDSIEAPHDYPSEVWRVLAAEGQLIDDSGGFYRLP